MIRALAMIALVLLAGCSGLAQPASTAAPSATDSPTPSPSPKATPSPTPTATETPTATQTATVPAVDGYDATGIDAVRLESQIDDSVAVDVQAIGALSVMWQMPSENATLPDSSANISEMSRTEKELLVIVRDYLALSGAGQINGSLSLTGVHDGERVSVWAIDEQWVREFHADEMESNELLSKIRNTRSDLRDSDQEGSQ